MGHDYQLLVVLSQGCIFYKIGSYLYWWDPVVLFVNICDRIVHNCALFTCYCNG